MAARYNKHDCAICLEDFSKPKLLPCAHTFCEDCLTDHIKAHASKNKFTCPVCRKITVVPAGGARGFPNNIYLVEDSEKTILFCPKHKEVELKFYCRDCSEIVCGDCVVLKHKGHDVDYTSTVEEERNQHLKPLTEELEEKVAELKKFSENLKLTVTDINSTADTACKNVDKQTERICDQLREQAQEIKQNIKHIRDDSNKTVQKLMEDIKRSITQKETVVNSSRDVFTGKSTSKSAVDILQNIHTLIESGRNTSLDSPEVIYPLFPLVDIDTQCLRKLLGELKTERAESVSVSFNAMEMKDGEFYESDVFMIQGLPWCVRVKRHYYMTVSLRLKEHVRVEEQGLPWRVVRHISDLFVYLGLTQGDKRVESCTADVTIKLVNKTEDSKYMVQKREGRTYSRNYGLNHMHIDWKCITYPSNGFLENNRFTLLTRVHVSKVNKL